MTFLGKTQTWDPRPSWEYRSYQECGPAYWNLGTPAKYRPGQSWWISSSKTPFTFGVPSHFIDRVNKGKGSWRTCPESPARKLQRPRQKLDLLFYYHASWAKITNPELKSWDEMWQVTGIHEKSQLRKQHGEWSIWGKTVMCEGRGLLGDQQAATSRHVVNQGLDGLVAMPSVKNHGKTWHSSLTPHCPQFPSIRSLELISFALKALWTQLSTDFSHLVDLSDIFW